MKVIVAGGSGFVGYALIKKLLKDGHSVVALTRRRDAFKNLPDHRLTVEWWDGKFVGTWAAQVEGADAVVNLSGEGIADKPWSIERKRLIKASRLEATHAVTSAIARCLKRPRVLVNASAVGFYGPVPDGDMTEASPKGKGYLADVCADLENEAKKAEALGVRVVLMRMRVALEKGGGAIQKMTTPFKLYAGGPLGSGRQWFPWVHRDDVLGTVLFAMQNGALSGPVNVVAPESLTMKQFCQALGKSMNRPSWAPVPGFVLKLLLGEMSSMLLTGQKAVPRKLQDAGYSFQYPVADAALTAIFQK